MGSKKSAKVSKNKKKLDADSSKGDIIKEKTYISKEVETSITLLESPEDGVVTEALLFLSKYADLQSKNLQLVQECGTLKKLLALLKREKCILRLSLRLISKLVLNVEDALNNITNGDYDEEILYICELFMTSPDQPVKDYCLEIIEKLSTTDKIYLLVREPDFLKIILNAIKVLEEPKPLLSNFTIFYHLLNIPGILNGVELDLTTFLAQFDKFLDVPITNTILNIFERLGILKELTNNVILRMFTLIADYTKLDYQIKALNIVKNAINDKNAHEIVETIEYLKFCEWLKKYECSDEVLFICAEIFEKLTEINSIKQLLFDLSVEDSLHQLLRTEDMKIIKKAFESISNMSCHKYCCEKMITAIVFKKLITMLQKNYNKEDPDSYIDENNDIFFKTLHNFAKRQTQTVYLICEYEGYNILFDYLKMGMPNLSDQNYTRVLEIFQMLVCQPSLKNKVLTNEFYETILNQIQFVDINSFLIIAEILINCVNQESFESNFLLLNGPRIIMNKLKDLNEIRLMRDLMVFIRNCLENKKMASAFLDEKLLLTLKALPDHIKYKIPLINKTIKSLYNICLPLKFFEYNRLDLTDRLPIDQRFYIINGPWKETFPFLEILEYQQVSTIFSIYVVDSCGQFCPKPHIVCFNIHDDSQDSTAINNSEASRSLILDLENSKINYGKLSHDPYLPHYYEKIDKLLKNIKNIEDKIKIIADFVDMQLCSSNENFTMADRKHYFKYHIQSLKLKLGTNMIPIGFLRVGFHCERSLLFKVLADRVFLPTTLVKGKDKMYWNKVALIERKDDGKFLQIHVVDLMNQIGKLYEVGSKDCQEYCYYKNVF